jgi:tRNA(adenine34) deaminase
MREALFEAEKALTVGEVPIGAVIVYDDKIIGRGHNLRTSKKNSLYHAEIIAINEACSFIGDWRLEGCKMFVTVEPCPMCAGAIIQSRIQEVVFGVKNPKAGCGGSILNILDESRFNHRAKIVEGVLDLECQQLIQYFFKKMRNEYSNKVQSVK